MVDGGVAAISEGARGAPARPDGRDRRSGAGRRTAGRLPSGPFRALLLLAASLPLWAMPARAEPCTPTLPSDLPSKARQWTPQEVWVWWQLRLSGQANLDEAICRDFDPRKVRDLQPGSEWRRLTSGFLLDLLRDEALAKSLQRRSLQIAGAWFDAPVNLSGVRLKHDLRMERVRFGGGLSLRGARFDGAVGLKDSLVVGPLNLEGTKVNGTLNLEGSHFERPGPESKEPVLAAGGLTTTESLWMGHGRFEGSVVLVEASIGDQLSAEKSSFAGEFDMNSAQVGLSAVLKGATFKDRVRFWNSKIGRFLDLRESRFEQGVDLSGVGIASQLYMGNCATFAGPVKLRDASIGGSVYADSAEFKAEVDMGGLRSGQSMFLGRSRGPEPGRAEASRCPGFEDPASGEPRRGATFSGHVSLAEARIGGALEMSGSNFDGDLNMGGLQLEGSLYMHNTSFGRILTLVGASVRGDVKFGGGRRPDRVNLVGFHYERILSGQLLEREPGDWVEAPLSWSVLNDELLSLQLPYSSQPYQHLASVLRRMGDVENATSALYESAKRAWDIRLKGADNERVKRVPAATGPASAWFGSTNVGAFLMIAAALPVWRMYGRPALALLPLSLAGILLAYLHGGAVLLWISALAGLLHRMVVGYGHYPEWAILWVAGFTTLGAVVLRFSPEARAKGLAWRFGASLDRLLPIVELNKEFGDFFDDPKRERLRGWQLAYFAFHALVGFALASFVVAGLSGLTTPG